MGGTGGKGRGISQRWNYDFMYTKKRAEDISKLFIICACIYTSLQLHTLCRDHESSWLVDTVTARVDSTELDG